MPQKIIWTALPNGLDLSGPSPILNLSVFVSPRLQFADQQTEGTLLSFPDFIDWPARLRTGLLSFSVVVDGDNASARPATISTTPDLQPRSAVWTVLFNGSTLLRTRDPDFSDLRQPISSYPTSQVMDGISNGYTDLGVNSPYRPANNQDLMHSFPALQRAGVARTTSRHAAILEGLNSIEAMTDADLAQMHRELSESFLDHDPGMSFSDKLVALEAIAGRRARAAAGKEAMPLILDTDDASSPFAQFAAFHHRAARKPSMRDRASAVKKQDFHQMLSSLCAYPKLLHLLGLVIDLQVAGDDFPTSQFGAVRQLQVIPKFRDAPTPDPEQYSPATKYLLNLQANKGPLPFAKFCAAPRHAEDAGETEALSLAFENVGGLLNLNVPRADSPQQFLYGLIQVDADGAALKILGAFNSMAIETQNAPVDGEREPGVPTLRTSGISLARANIRDTVSAKLDQATQQEGSFGRNEIIALTAEDLVRGYRVDVRRLPANFMSLARNAPDAPKWLSLHRRLGKYTGKTPDGVDPLPEQIADEGFIQPVLAQNVQSGPPGAGTTATIYIPESLCHWQGYGLSASPPLTPLQTDPGGSTDASDPLGLPDFAVKLDVAPGSLPRLRFGDFYQFRIRTADLAGNGPSVDDADTLLRTLESNHRPSPIKPIKPNEFRYLRFDPILPPVLVPREQLTEGEAPDVMVIRSNAGSGVAAADYAARLGDPKYKGNNDRHIVPEKGSSRAAEAHGMFDAAFGANGDPSRSFNIQQRDNGKLSDTAFIDIATGTAVPLPDVVLPNPVTGVADTIPNGVKPFAAPGGSSSYTVHYETQLQLPYLPDPLARGAALFGLPGTEQTSGAIDPDTGALIFLNSDHQVLPKEAYMQLGFVTQIDFGTRDEWPDLKPFILRLEEATGRSGDGLPSWDAQARVLTVTLGAGETAKVWLSCYPDKDDISLFGLHALWGQRVGSTAEQREFLNTAEHGALAMLTPARRLTLVHAVQQPMRLQTLSSDHSFGIERFADDTSVYFSGRFGIHAASTTKLDLLARWGEPDEAGGDPTSVKTHVLEIPIFEGGLAATAGQSPAPIATYDNESLQFLSPPAIAAPLARQGFTAKFDFGDTRYRKVTFRLIATTRYVEYFPKALLPPPTEQNPDVFTRSLEIVERVPSTRAPAAPEIDSVVPLFGWQELTQLGDITQRSRIGGGLRVYLGATWYSSGDGEQLAVVDASGGAAGLDPIHGASRMVAAGLIVPHGPPVSGHGFGPVFLFDVQFDKTRKLWFGDIRFDIGNAYFPFTQLTLARYQPNALDGINLSKTVDAGMHQLAPDRTVTLAYQDLQAQRQVHITISGNAPSTIPLPHGSRGNVFDVSLQQRNTGPEEADEDLDWNLLSAQPPVVDSRPGPADQLWAGSILVPISDTTEHRIVIKEFELYPANAGDPPGQGLLGGPVIGGSGSFRLVYADTIIVV